MLVSDNLEMVASELMTLEYHREKKIVWREEMHRHTHTHQLAARVPENGFCLLLVFKLLLMILKIAGKELQ